MTVRVLIVDDHDVVRQGLKMFLRADRELHIVGEAANGQEAIRLARELHPDIVLMDILMPGMDGIAATTALKRELPETEVVVLTSVIERDSVVEAIRVGAIGYLLKDTKAVDLRRAIKAAAAHQVQLSAEAAARLAHAVQVPVDLPALTERETDVLRLLAAGQSNKEITANLQVGEETVKTHVSNVLGKLGVSTRTQAALVAVRLGLIRDK